VTKSVKKKKKKVKKAEYGSQQKNLTLFMALSIYPYYIGEAHLKGNILSVHRTHHHHHHMTRRPHYCTPHTNYYTKKAYSLRKK